MCDELKKEHGLEGMTLQYTTAGFVFSCPAVEWEEKAGEVAKVFLNMVRGLRANPR